MTKHYLLAGLLCALSCATASRSVKQVGAVAQQAQVTLASEVNPTLQELRVAETRLYSNTLPALESAARESTNAQVVAIAIKDLCGSLKLDMHRIAVVMVKRIDISSDNAEANRPLWILAIGSIVGSVAVYLVGHAFTSRRGKAV